MAPQSTPASFDGFSVLNIPYFPGAPFGRQLLCKKHARTGENDPWPEGRTLFVTSLDASTSEAQLKASMEAFGGVASVTIKRSDKPLKQAWARQEALAETVVLGHVVFKKAAALDACLGRKAEAVLPLPASGKKKMLAARAKRFRESEELQREVDAWMEEYEERERLAASALAEQEVDEDGFTIVRSDMRATRTKDRDATVRAFKPPQQSLGAFRKAEEVNAKKRKRQDHEGFYNFQTRQKAAEELVKFREEKERDAETVAAMRKDKRFKKIVAE